MSSVTALSLFFSGLTIPVLPGSDDSHGRNPWVARRKSLVDKFGYPQDRDLLNKMTQKKIQLKLPLS